MVMKLFLLCLLAVGAYGGYYGYCKYKLKDVAFEFSQTTRDLHMAVLRKTTKIREGDVEAVVRAMAAKHNLEVVELEVTLVPLSTCNSAKLPRLLREALKRHDEILQDRPSVPGLGSLAPAKQTYHLAGFAGIFGAKYKIAKGTFTSERFTRFEDEVVAK